MKKILITGISGFVGKYLEQYFRSFYEIIGVGRSRMINYGNFAATDYDVVIHLAGKAHDLKNVTEPEEYYQVNYELTKKIYDTFNTSSAQIFVFISSVKAAVDKSEYEVTENIVPTPNTHYGKSKLMAEQYILANIKSDKRVFVLRPCIIYGDGNKGNLKLLFDMIKKGVPYPLGAFENKRSFLSIDNLCFVIKEIIENDNVESGIFNIADNDAISTNELIDIMNATLNKKTPILKIPKKIIYTLAKIGDIFKLPLNSEKLNKLTENYVVSNFKVRSSIKKELPYTTKDGLLETFQNY